MERRQIVLLTGGRGHSGTDSDFSIWAFNFFTSSSNLAFTFCSSTIFWSSMGWLVRGHFRDRIIFRWGTISSLAATAAEGSLFRSFIFFFYVLRRFFWIFTTLWSLLFRDEHPPLLAISLPAPFPKIVYIKLKLFFLWSKLKCENIVYQRPAAWCWRRLNNFYAPMSPLIEAMRT